MADTSIRTVNDIPVGDVSAQVVLHLSPFPRIYIEVDNIKLPADFDESSEVLEITVDSNARLEVNTNLTRYERNRAKMLCKGPFILRGRTDTAMESRGRLSEVQFGLLNFPDFLGEEYLPRRIDPEGYVRVNVVTLRASKWIITLNAFRNTRDITRQLRAVGGYGLTHEGSIQRSDGRSFSAKEVPQLLQLLHLFFSFARGANCGLLPVIGISDEGQYIWETWSAGTTSPWSAYRSWFDHNHGLALTELFPGFYGKLWEARKHHPLVMALNWYLLSNETRKYEGSIVLTQAALERLSQQLAGARRKNKGEWIVAALNRAKIPTALSELRDLKEFMNVNGWENGPHALAEIRNDLVHSEMEHQTSSSNVYAQAEKLGLWYTELMLLYIFGYKGKYGNRLTQEWRGDVEQVPWVLED